jgi:hypothetical protein
MPYHWWSSHWKGQEYGSTPSSEKWGDVCFGIIRNLKGGKGHEFMRGRRCHVVSLVLIIAAIDAQYYNI